MIKYIGLDAHSSTCTFNVTDERGREIDNTAIETKFSRRRCEIEEPV